MQDNLLEILESYKSVISSFKKRGDVQNGKALAFKGSNEVAAFENSPKSIGDGLSTTGWCVSASQALLIDKIFQITLGFRKATAHLVSIDIKEQYYGYCYNGSQNKWHTAILVKDSGIQFIIDITCSQFGNDFINKDIWDFNTWALKLRHPYCKHTISEELDNVSDYAPIENKQSESDLELITLKDSLSVITNVTSEERELIADFFLMKFNELNKKLIIGNISVNDYKYINKINKLLMGLPFETINSGYSIIGFENKQAAKNWLKLFLEGKGKLPMNLLVSKTVLDSCKINCIDNEEINISYKSSRNPHKTYLIFEFGNLYGIDTNWLKNSSILLPYGIVVNFTPENIYNGGKRIVGNILEDGKLIKETNTIYVKIDN